MSFFSPLALSVSSPPSLIHVFLSLHLFLLLQGLAFHLRRMFPLHLPVVQLILFLLLQLYSGYLSGKRQADVQMTISKKELEFCPSLSVKNITCVIAIKNT